MVTFITVNGKITVDQDGEYMKINKLVISMLVIGRKIRKMVMGNKKLLVMLMRVNLYRIRKMVLE